MNVGVAGDCHLDLVEDSPLLHLSAPATTLLPYYAPDLHVLSHTPNGKMYLDGTLLASNITSVTVLGDLVLYIVNDVTPRLCLLPLTQLASFASFTQAPSCVPTLPIASRALERGSLYIGCGRDGRVIVQLPRGNLETFYPRLLSCRMLEQYLFGSERPERWRTVVELMRRQRIRRSGSWERDVALDVLYDLDPAYFCSHAEEFVRSQKSVDRIHLLLSNLVE